MGFKLNKSTTYSTATLLIGLLSTGANAGWEVQWIERFDGDSVNWNNWSAQTEANYNNEVQCYTADDYSTQQNYDVSDGTLKIIARKKTHACPTLGNQTKEWTSGRLNSKDKREFLYGRIESRIKFHNLEQGTWPAFWMLENRISEQPIKGDNDNVNWPNPGAGEIDVWEWFSNQPNTYITNFFNTSGCAEEVRYTYPNGSSDVLNWHNYAMEWTPERIDFFIDETLVSSQDVSGCPQYKEPMFILLNLAMGGNLGGYIDPTLQQATLEVDFVAHCQSTVDNQAIRCDESTPTNGELEHNEQLNLIVYQNGVPTSAVDTSMGEVEVRATFSAEPNLDNYILTWNSGRLTSATEEGNALKFDPSSLPSGHYTVTANLTSLDDADFSLTQHHSLEVKNGDDIADEQDQSTSPDSTSANSSSGGATSGSIAMFLALVVVFRRYFLGVRR